MFTKIINKIYSKKALNKEKEYIYYENIKYLFIDDSKKNDEDLIIVFSGFPAKEKKAVYNYVNTLRKIKKKKLFILDDFGSDKRGAYYLGYNGNLSIYKSVNNLIDSIIETNNISNVISCGSSKGGFAALLFGIKNSYSHIIVGEPQFYLGTYLSTKEHKYIFEYIMGAYTEEKKEHLDKLLENEIVRNKEKSKSKIYINYGKHGEYQKTHISGLIKCLKNNDFSFSIVEDDFKEHNDLILFFPNFILNTLKKIEDQAK